MIKVTQQLLDSVSAEASLSPRKRKNYNFHKNDSDLLQRMLNAMEPATYVRPHKHVYPDKREVFILLKGKIAVVEFDDAGKIIDHIILNPKLGNFAAEIATASWHTVISLENNSVYYEVKDGPYDPHSDKVFADWSPEEGSADANKYLSKILEQLY